MKKGEQRSLLSLRCWGDNIFEVGGRCSNAYCYTINDDNEIVAEPLYKYDSKQYLLFSLEEFIEKFPYKVGDRVVAYYKGILAQFTIQDMRWNPELNKVEYKICSSWLDASAICRGILLSPTEEIRNTFFNNSKDLIEECKELL